MDAKHDQLEIVSRKVAVCLSREPPERAAAIAAIDYYLRERGHKASDSEDGVADDDNLEDLGVDPRSVTLIDKHLGVHSVGGLRSLTLDQLQSVPYLGLFAIQGIAKTLDARGIKHKICFSLDSSESASRSPEEDLADRLLEYWQCSQVAEV